VEDTAQLTPELTSNDTYNEIKETSYSVTTNPGDAGSVTSAGVFSATAAGNYTVTATVTYNAIGYTSITKDATATVDITVSNDHTVTYHEGSCPTDSLSGSAPAAGTKVSGSPYSILGNTGSLSRPGYTFGGWNTTDGAGVATYSAGDSYTTEANLDLYPVWVEDSVGSAAGSPFSVKKGMSIYLYDDDSVYSSETPVFTFATSSSGANETTVTTGTAESGYFFANAPGDNYKYFKITSTDKDSGYIPITSLEKNMLTLDGGKFTTIGYADFTSTNYSNVYFDNSLSNWTINDNLYLVLGSSSNQTMVKMSKVANTSQLYYVPYGDTTHAYTYIAFATAAAAHTGAYAPTDASHGILNVATNITTFTSVYNLAYTSDYKTYIGIPMNSGKLSALDMLWVRDSAIDGTGLINSSNNDGAAANEGRYLNRKVTMTVDGRGTAYMSGFKATSGGTAGVAAQAAVSATTSVYGSNGSVDAYYVRSSTVTISGITPANGYTVNNVTYSYDSVIDAVATNNGDGTYSFTLPGDDDNGAADAVQVKVNLTRGHPDVMLLGLWRSGATEAEANRLWNNDVTVNSERVMTYAATLDVDGDGTEDFTDAYYIDLDLDAVNYYKSWHVNGDSSASNGFKIYDSDTDSYYGRDHALNTSSNYIDIYSNNDQNIEIQNEGNFAGTFRFVYYISETTHYIKVFYPNLVTYNLKDGDTPNTETRSIQYGEVAENWTPVRAGYVFDYWCSDPECNTRYLFNDKITTSGVTLYAKWTTYNATATLDATNNGSAYGTSSTSSVFTGAADATITAPDAPSGSVFAGWKKSGSMAGHVTLYTDAECTTPYLAGDTSYTTVYILSDGSDGINSSTLTVTAVFLSRSYVTVTTGSAASANLTAVNGVSADASSTDYASQFNYGQKVTVTFGGLAVNMGINTVSFADGQSVEYINDGQAISFTMPDHPVTITNISLSTRSCKLTIKNSEKVDVDNLASGGYYATGATLNNVTLRGADDYDGASVINSVTATFVGGGTITVANGSSDTLEYNGHTITITITDHVAVITGNIGGSLNITPICSTNYNVNITSTVMSDVYAGYTSFYKSTKISTDGKIADQTKWLAELKAYVYYEGIAADAASVISEADDVAKAAKAAGYGLAYDKNTEATNDGSLITGSFESKTFYLIAEDVDGDYINAFPEGSLIHLVATGVSNASGTNLDPYMFLGWYKGSSTGPDFSAAPLSSEEGGYTYTLNASSFIYATITRDLYVGGYSDDSAWMTAYDVDWTKATRMTYDATNKVYYKEFEVNASSDSGANNFYEFRLYDQASTGNSNELGTNNQAVWANAAHTITSEAQALYGGGFSWSHNSSDPNGRARFYLSSTVASAVQAGTVDSSKYLVRLYYKPSTEEVYMIPVYNASHKEVYLSNGRIDGLSLLGQTVSAVTTFTPAGASDTTPSGGTTETFQYHSIASSTTFTFSTTLSGTDKDNAEVAGFVLYNLDTGAASTIEPAVVGNTYTGSATINYNAFICPVYELTDSFISGQDTIKAYDVSVQAAEVDKNVWGGLVAMYLFGSSAKDYNGAWPGQLMLPEGSSYTGTVYNKGTDLTGIVFNNYNVTSSFINEFADRFNYPDNSQTYDYLEPITLMAQGDHQVLSFDLKQNNDGYHGFYFNSNAINYGPYRLDTTAGNTETNVGQAYNFHDENLNKDLSIDDVYTFDYLMNAAGTQRLNLYGNEVGSASAGYYIICVGDTDYKYNSTPHSTYTPNGTYNGQYSVEWYVYDADGVFLLHTLSDALYNKNGSAVPYIVTKLLESGLTDEASLTEKSVKISYEGPNTRSGSTRFSGQWYTTSTVTKVTVYAGVGMIDTNGNAIVPENPQSSASYGSVDISFDGAATTPVKDTFAGLAFGNLLVSDATAGYVILTATVPSTSTFMGWYSYNETTGTYTPIEGATATTYRPKFSVESRYYAMFAAQATYVFEYTGRSGTRTYSVKSDIAASAGELTSGGTLVASTSNGTMTRTEEISSIITAISTGKSAEIFNKTVTFSTDPETWNYTEPYTIKITGADVSTDYTLHVYGYYDNSGSVSELGSITDNYNTIIDLNNASLTHKPAGVSIASMKPSGNNSMQFLGWKKYSGDTAVGDYISTHANFGYSLTDNLSIVAVFGTVDDRTGEWKAYVDKNVIGVEMTDSTNGKIYNDNIVRFTYGTDSARLVSDDESITETGVVILAQTKAAYDNATYRSKFDGCTGKLANYLNALGANNSARMNSANYGTSYAFKIKAESLSRLNRIDICQVLDYAAFSGGQFILAAYYKDGSGYHVSSYVKADYAPGNNYMN
jgi:hypothetical protein